MAGKYVGVDGRCHIYHMKPQPSPSAGGLCTANSRPHAAWKVYNTLPNPAQNRTTCKQPPTTRLPLSISQPRVSSCDRSAKSSSWPITARCMWHCQGRRHAAQLGRLLSQHGHMALHMQQRRRSVYAAGILQSVCASMLKRHAVDISGAEMPSTLSPACV